VVTMPKHARMWGTHDYKGNSQSGIRVAVGCSSASTSKQEPTFKGSDLRNKRLTFAIKEKSMLATK
jgi:hypothetical protein